MTTETIHYIRRAEFESRSHRCGSDAWNPDAIASKAFRYFPEASAVSWEYVGTGLWVDVQIHTATGHPRSVRLTF